MKNLFLDLLLLINAMQAIHNLLLVRYDHISRKSYRRIQQIKARHVRKFHIQKHQIRLILKDMPLA